MAAGGSTLCGGYNFALWILLRGESGSLPGVLTNNVGAPRNGARDRLTWAVHHAIVYVVYIFGSCLSISFQLPNHISFSHSPPPRSPPPLTNPIESDRKTARFVYLFLCILFLIKYYSAFVTLDYYTN